MDRAAQIRYDIPDWPEYVTYEGKCEGSRNALSRSYYIRMKIGDYIFQIRRKMVSLQNSKKELVTESELIDEAMNDYNAAKSNSRSQAHSDSSGSDISYEDPGYVSSDDRVVNDTDFMNCEYRKLEIETELEVIEGKTIELQEQLAKLESDKPSFSWVDTIDAGLVRIDQPLLFGENNPAHIMEQGKGATENEENEADGDNDDTDKLVPILSLAVAKVYDTIGPPKLKESSDGPHETLTEVRQMMQLIKGDYTETGLLPIILVLPVPWNMIGRPVQWLTAVITPRCERGNIEHWVTSLGQQKHLLQYDPQFIYTEAMKILVSLTRLANMRQHHGHIKPKNLLISEGGKHLLLSDFCGISYVKRYYSTLNKVVDPYIAPEVYKTITNPHELQNFDNIDWLKADYFSLGLCLFYIITRTEPDHRFQRSKSYAENTIETLDTGNHDLDKLIRSLTAWKPSNRTCNSGSAFWNNWTWRNLF